MAPASVLLEPDARLGVVRRPVEDPRASSEANFQEAIDARRAERVRAASKGESAETRPGGEERVQAQERDARESETRASANDDEAGCEAAGEQAPDRPERGLDARKGRETGAESVVAKGRRLSPVACLDATGSSKEPGSAGREVAAPTAPDQAWLAHAALEARLSAMLAGAPSSSGTAAAPDFEPRNPSVRSAAALAPVEESSLGQRSKPSPGGPAAAAIDATLSGANAPDADPQAVRHAGRAIGLPAPAVDGALAPGAAPGAPAPEVVHREPYTPRLTPAELQGFFGRLALRIDSPERSAVVELEPAELGRVSIALSLEREGHVRAEVHAQRPDGYAALEARLPELRASLIERGFASASVSLSLGLADSPSHRSGTEDDRSNPSPARGTSLANAETQALLSALPPISGAIDLWA